MSDLPKGIFHDLPIRGMHHALAEAGSRLECSMTGGHLIVNQSISWIMNVSQDLGIEMYPTRSRRSARRGMNGSRTDSEEGVEIGFEKKTDTMTWQYARRTGKRGITTRG
jgi:hypothetical protein